MMSLAVPMMEADLGTPLSNLIWATDAMGATERDAGGYGIVATATPMWLAEKCLDAGRAVGRTVATLDGGRGLKFPDKCIKPTIPFSRLPANLFKQDWVVVEKGRWNRVDHITLGETRALVQLCRRLAVEPQAHRRRFITLQDNGATAGATEKGRSPAPALNRLLRKKAAQCLAAGMVLHFPWVETLKMPADRASRD